jgi:hypothetical protein
MKFNIYWLSLIIYEGICALYYNHMGLIGLVFVQLAFSAMFYEEKRE